MRDPFDDIRKAQEEMARLFGSLLGAAFGNSGSFSGFSTQGMRSPEADVWETDEHVVIHMEVPGASKEDIEIHTIHGGIEVRIEQSQEAEEEDEGYRSYHSSRKSYYKQVPLPDYAEADKAEASYENGILEVKIPKKETGKGKRIDVK